MSATLHELCTGTHTCNVPCVHEHQTTKARRLALNGVACQGSVSPFHAAADVGSWTMSALLQPCAMFVVVIDLHNAYLHLCTCACHCVCVYV
jgi:hypothetical protein